MHCFYCFHTKNREGGTLSPLPPIITKVYLPPIITKVNALGSDSDPVNIDTNPNYPVCYNIAVHCREKYLADLAP